MGKPERKVVPRAVLRVRVQPKASRNGIRVGDDGRIRVALTAPPVEGEANRALCAFVARVMGVPKSAVTVVGGVRSREKAIAVEGISEEDAQRKLTVSDCV